MSPREVTPHNDAARKSRPLFNSIGIDHPLKRSFAAAALAAALGLSATSGYGQSKAPAPPARIEPGLETARLWKWRIVPAEEKEWGLPLPEVPAPALPATSVTTPISGSPSSGTPGSPAQPRPSEYTVAKGDALILIGKKFGMTAYQLKTFNGLTVDTIRIGQVLKIPTMEELNSLPATAPPPEPKVKPKDKEKEEESAPPAPKAQPVIEIPGREDLITQVFLDREGFATGPIDGNAGPMLAAVSQLYRDTHEDAQNMDSFRQKVRSTVVDPITRYTLKTEDFRFIDEPNAPKSSSGKKKSKASAEVPPTYDDLVTATSLVYRSAWEFVAERYHCDEAFLRSLNSRIKGAPVAGTQLQVPDVIPFEVEHALEGTLQPVADPAHPVTAALVELSRLEISRDAKVIAVMPLALARPDLRGRGAWTVLDAIPRPKLATLQELKDPPKVPAPLAPMAPGAPTLPASTPAPVVAKPVLTTEQFLPAGPNNPVGIVWINLAKAKSTEPLPYGLHGTSIPSRMKTQEGIGGIRLTNWDMARAVRLLPAGTPLQWR